MAGFRFRLAFAFLMAAGFCAGAENVGLFLDAAPSEMNGSKAEVEIPAEFDGKWFTEKSAFEYDHRIARIACFLSDSAYTDVLSDPDGNLLKRNYGRLGAEDGAMEFHYDVDYSDSIWGNDQCACSFAVMKIGGRGGGDGKGSGNSRKRSLVLCVLRGTPFGANEWLSNLNINDAGETQNEIHKGFALAASAAHTQLISFMLRHKVDPTESCILITGHSRGAAVANLLSVILLADGFFDEGSIFTYTFAAPNTTTDENAHDAKYGFIWNIVNPEDVVPTVPLYRGSWKFTKYGRTKAFASAVTAGKDSFDSEYFPRINGVYKNISGRDYAPFTTGPLVPVMITRIFESLAANVEKYYSGFLDLHARFSAAMKKIFPDNENPEADDTPDDVKKGGVGSWLISWLNKRTGGGIDYLKLAFNDMHTCNVYLAFMLSLDESEAFSETNYSVAVVKGTEEIGIFDKDGNVMARVMNGKIKYSDIRLPVVLVPAGRKSVLIGCPVTEGYKVCVTDETLLPTPCPVTIEYFDAAGVYIESSGKEYLYPRTGRVYEFEIGKPRIEKFAGGGKEIERVKMAKADGKKAVKDARLKPQLAFNIVPEIYSDTNWNLGGGVHIGNQLVFGSIMTSFGLTRFGKAAELSPGIGNQLSVFANIKLENEVFGRCLWLERDDDGDKMFNFVPSFRSSLSMKMIGRITLFSAGVFDFKIDGFNDEAFDDDVKRRRIPTFRISDKVRAAPSIQFGVRF